jgi:hypothetical protein
MESESKNFKKEEPISYEEANIEGLARYLSGDWVPDKEKYQHLRKEAYGGPPVFELAQNSELITDYVNKIRKAGKIVPEIVQNYLNNLLEIEKQIDEAFKSGECISVTIPLTEENVIPGAFSTDQPPEQLPVKIALTKNSDPNQPANWHIQFETDGHSVSHKRIRIQDVKKTEQGFHISFNGGEGDETGGDTYEGELIIDPAINHVVSADITFENSHPDGGCDGRYRLSSIE